MSPIILNESHRLKITADICDGRYIVCLDECLVGLPLARFEALLALVLCRLARVKGYTGLRDFGVAGDKQLLHTTIRRLRLDFDHALGSGAGMNLIRHLGKSTYQLAVPQNRIEISPDLIELADEHLSATFVRSLLEQAKECQQCASVLSGEPE